MTDQVVLNPLASPVLATPAERPAVPVEPLLATTFDQLRTFDTVCRLGNVRAAARALGRDHSSVRKQLDTLEERFEAAARGKLLVHPSSRGGAIHVTEYGRRVQEFAQRSLSSLESTWHELHKVRRDRALRFGVSGFGAYVGEFLAQTHEVIAREFEHRGMSYLREVVPVPSMKPDQSLIERADLDFVFGAAICRKEHPPAFDAALAFTEWSRDTFVVLSNIDIGSGPLGSRVILERQIPLVAPRRGVIFDLMVAELDEAERQRLNVVEWCDDGPIAIDILHHNLRHAALFCSQTFARFARSRIGSEHLRIVPYECELTHRFGILVRKADLAGWSAGHPARLFWELTGTLAATRKQAAPRARKAARRDLPRNRRSA